MTAFYEGPTGRSRLLRTHEAVNTGCFSDLLYCCAVTVEDGFLLGGALPGVDYSRAKLFELAMPLALSMRTAQTTITTCVPNEHPGAGLKRGIPSNESEVMHALAITGTSTSKRLSAHLRRGSKNPRTSDALRSLVERGLVRKLPGRDPVPDDHLYELVTP